MRLEDFIDEQSMETLNRPTGAAEGLPGAAYGQDFYDLEQRTLFPKVWAAVAVGAQLPETGDLLPVELAGHPLLLARGPDGAIRCFHNICRHRVTRLPEALAGQTFPLLPHAARLATGYFIGHLLPTMTLVIDPEEVAVVLIVPLDGETTRLDLYIHFLGDAATDDAHAAMRERRKKEWRIVLDRDLPYARGVQKNAAWRDKAGIRTRFSPYWEHAVRDFQHIVVNTLRNGIS